MSWYLAVLKKYVDFNGRARRMEYWMFVLINSVIALIFLAIDQLTGTPILNSLYTLAVFLPSLAVTIRRLHDTDRAGWWVLIVLIPFAGPIILLVFECLPGTPGDNQYGEDPKAITE